MGEAELRRRELIGLGAATAVGWLGMRGQAFSAQAGGRTDVLDFATHGAGEGWPGWTCAGTANLRRETGRGLLQAGTDVFPCDPRPVAFAVDHRFRDGEIAASLSAAGAGAGLVLRRTGFRAYYAAILDQEQAELAIVARVGERVSKLARASFIAVGTPFAVTFAAEGSGPTRLRAIVRTAAGAETVVTATDGTPELQQAGDPGVLATARTLFPSEGVPGLPALGNVRLLPYGVQEGQAVIGTPIGKALLDSIGERSTAAFSRIELRSAEDRAPTRPSVIAATAGPPVPKGARLRVATDVPARVEIELATGPGFRRSRRLRLGVTDAFRAKLATAASLPANRRVYWRARVSRRGRESVGPVSSFVTPPRAGSRARASVAIGSCASQFGPIFDQIAEAAPHVFVWQGDLNYPDTMGPLAQTTTGYAGIWREFLANPRMAGILERTLFAAQRDDHDFGLQDANATNLLPWGLAPWESLVESRRFYRFNTGLAAVWVLDQRSYKSDPALPDTADKSLLGIGQRRWLLRTLERSSAPFKVVCSPCTLAPLPANARDGSWAAGFTAERELLLDHIKRNVRGTTIFVTGDTHWTLVYEDPRLFEARPCPLGIPTPNDITLTNPQAAEEASGRRGVVYANDDRGHFALIEVHGSGRRDAFLDLKLVRDDGATAFRRTFQQRRP